MLPNACPKPKPKLKAPKTLRKVNKARKKLDDERVYGSKARRKWVSMQPCAACGEWGFSENAHVLGNDGAGRKAGYKTIAPLCGVRPVSGGAIYEGCHAMSHRSPEEFRKHFPQFSGKKATRDTEKRWQIFLKSESR